MAARVQYVSVGSSSAVTTLTRTITATTGNLLLVVAEAWASLSGVSDGVNTYTPLSGNTLYNAAWYAKNITGGALSIVVTCTSGQIAIGVLEVSGASTTAPVDQQAAAAFSTTVLASGTTSAAASASDLVVGLAGWTGTTAYTLSAQAFTTALTTQTNETAQVSSGSPGNAAVACSNGPIAGLDTEKFTGTLSGSPNGGGEAWCVLIAPGGTVNTKNITGALTFTGTRQSVTGRRLSAMLTFSGTQKRATSRGVLGALTFAGTTAKVTTKKLASGALSFTGTLAHSHVFTRALSGALTFAGTLTSPRIYTRALSGALSFAGTLSQNSIFSRALSGALTFLGRLILPADETISIITAYTPPGWSVDTPDGLNWMLSYQLPYNPATCTIQFGFSSDPLGETWSWYPGSYVTYSLGVGTIYLATCWIGPVSPFDPTVGTTYQCMIQVAGASPSPAYYPVGTLVASWT